MLIAGLALMACSPPATDTASTTPASTTPATPQSAPAPTPPPATAEDTCNMAQYAALVGKPSTDPGVPAAGPTVRIIKPGDQVTMEFMATRLNINLDDKGMIASMRCG